MSIAQDANARGGAIEVNRVPSLRTGVLASLTLVILAAIASLVLVGGIERQNADVEHSYEVRSQARELTMALGEAQSSQRGYVLTGDQSYFEPYHRATAAVQTRLATLAALVSENAKQSAEIAGISQGIDAAMSGLQRAMDLVAEQPEQARELVQLGGENMPLEPLRRALDQFTAEESQVLHARTKALSEWGRWLVGAIVLSLAGAVILAFVFITRTQQQVGALAKSQTRLIGENEILDARVRERTLALEEAREHAERERERVEALLQDVSHRIGNSLATVSSLLGLQLLRSNSAEVRTALESARARVHAIAAAHRRLRLGEDMETASAEDFLGAVLEDLGTTISTAERINLTGEIEPIVIKARDATTLGILLSELVTNAIKHAFPHGDGGNIEVRLSRDEGIATLSVRDNGVGLQQSELPSNDGLGAVIIRQLAHQFGGVPHYDRAEAGGLLVRIPLPGLDSKKPS